MDRIINALVDQWIYDIQVMSQGWVLWLIFPALLYMAFMFIKWAVLTCPVWLPVTIAIKAIRKQNS